MDMRGYGDSEKPVGIRYYRMKYLIEDVKNLIEALGKFHVCFVIFKTLLLITKYIYFIVYMKTFLNFFN